MKTLFSLVLATVISLSAFSQVSPGTLTIELKGNQNRQIIIDGNDYTPAGLNSLTDASVTISDLQAGQHRLRIVRDRQDDVNTVFILRNNYDKKIVVSVYGGLQQSETIKSFGAGSKPAMLNAQFRVLSNSVRMERNAYNKRAILTEAFSRNGNYFTTMQVRQLLQLINPEGARFDLAKLSYPVITDPWNFNQVVILFNSRARRNQLKAYAEAYVLDNQDNTGYRVAMSMASFNNVYRNIQSQYSQSGRITLATSAFNTSGNYFSTTQAKQIILLVSNERSRLDLVKLSYRSVVDPENFNQMNDVLNSWTSRNELATFIRSQTSNESAMSDSRFNALYQDVRNKYSVTARNAALAAAFSNTTNFYTTSQARQLLLLISSESDRLELAKQSYRGIVDPANFTQVYDVLSSQYSRNQLAAYVSSYYGAGDYTPKPPMADVSFNAMYRDVQFTFGFGAKMSELTKIFANTTYYFTTDQAERLIRLVSDEANRLQLAKSAYSHITDPVNFPQLYDVLTSQSSRNELDAYVKNYGSNTGYDNNGYPYRVAMADYEFRILYSDISNRFGLGAKMTALTDVFAKQNNYFTVVQAEQLIRLVSAEENRLQLAKQAYSHITDPQNFADVYDMFGSQASIDELKEYVRFPR